MAPGTAGVGTAVASAWASCGRRVAAPSSVSAAVVVAGLAIQLTGRTWIDPAISLAIGVALWGMTVAFMRSRGEKPGRSMSHLNAEGPVN